jgi:hypothetical protein
MRHGRARVWGRRSEMRVARKQGREEQVERRTGMISATDGAG